MPHHKAVDKASSATVQKLKPISRYRHQLVVQEPAGDDDVDDDDDDADDDDDEFDDNHDDDGEDTRRWVGTFLENYFRKIISRPQDGVGVQKKKNMRQCHIEADIQILLTKISWEVGCRWRHR